MTLEGAWSPPRLRQATNWWLLPEAGEASVHSSVMSTTATVSDLRRRAALGIGCRLRSRWGLGIVIAVVAMTVRGIALWELRSSPRWEVLLGDAARYHEWAGRIAAGDWLGRETFYQAPLYPYVLALLYCVTGPSVTAGRILNVLCGVSGCVLTGLAGWRLFGLRAGLMAGLALALSGPEVFHETLLEKSALGTLLVAALLLAASSCLRRPRHRLPWVALGTTLGLWGLVRENALLCGGLILVWIALFPRSGGAPGWKRRKAALFLAGLLLPLAPVLVRNHIVGGEWVLTTAQFGPNFYIGNNREADGTYQELVPEHGTPAFEQSDARAIAEEAMGRPLSPAEVSRWWTRRTWDDIQSAPGRWANLMVQKLLLTWSNRELVDSEDQYTAAEESGVLWVLSGIGRFDLLASLALFGLAALGRKQRLFWVLPALIVLYTFSVALFYVFARYRLPLAPMLALLAGAGLVRGVTLLRRRRTGRVVAGAAAALVGAAVMQPGVVGPWFPRWPDLSIPRTKAVTQFNLAVKLWKREAPLEAIEPHLQAATRLLPEYTSAWFYWGLILLDHGDLDGGAARLKEALHCDPERADIRVELGEALLRLGRPEEAIGVLEPAVSLASDDPDVHHLLGRALVLAGRPQEATAPLETAVRLDPDFALPRHLLAITLDRLGRHEEAREQFEDLLQRLPVDSVEAAAIRRRLGNPRSPLKKP